MKAITYEMLDKSLKEKIVKCLIQMRYLSAGLERKEFMRGSQQRSRLRAFLKIADLEKLKWNTVTFGNFFQEEEDVVYRGSHPNEEITMIIEKLLDLNVYKRRIKNNNG